MEDNRTPIKIQRDTNPEIRLDVLSMGDIQIPNIRVRATKDVDEDFLYNIRSNGLLEPITVAEASDGKSYVLIHGLRRFIAMSMNGEKSIPCLIKTGVQPDDILYKEPLYNSGIKYCLGELNELAKKAEKSGKLNSPSQFDALLGLAQGNYLKLKAILEYGMEVEDLDKDILNLMSDKKSDPNSLIDKTFKKMERLKKKAEKESEEGEEPQDGADDGFNEQLGDSNEECNFEEPMPSEEMRKFIVTKFRYSCACGCGVAGEQYYDILKAYSVTKPIFGGEFKEDNLISLCPNCYALVVRYGLGDSLLPNSIKYATKIAKYGQKLRDDIAESGKPTEFFKGYFKKIL